MEYFLLFVSFAIVANIFFYALNPKKFMEINKKIDEFMDDNKN